ncbi:MAG TPA: tetratricopeptide repeat protein [Candidatus Latescibacteria bacterium]|nr:tetratricopeptide repeat protein [Candidatus Latescibacterota bacterium]
MRQPPSIGTRVGVTHAAGVALTAALLASAAGLSAQQEAVADAEADEGAPLLRLVQEAELLVRQGQLELALTRYEEAVKEGAGSADVLNRTAELYLAHGNPQRAVSLLQRSLQELPGQLPVYSGLNEAFLAMGRLDSALYYVQEARRLSPENSGVRSQLGYLHLQAGHLKQARAHLDSALLLDDRNVPAHRLVALYYTQVELPDSAVARYQRVLELAPDDVEAHNNIAFLLAAQKQFLPALEWYRKTKALADDPQLQHAVNLNMEAIRAIMDGKMRARYILVESESLAIDLRQRIDEQGEDFRELAARFSKAPNARDGGDLGFFGPGDMLPSVEESVLQLRVGEISPVIQMARGYMLIQRLN